MDFELLDEQKDIQKAAREFAKGEIDPDLVSQLDWSREFPESIWKKAAKLGFIGIHYPEEFGGQGLGFLENILVIEEFCRADSGIGSALSAVDLGSEVILKFGSQEQKRRFIPPLAKGEKRLSFAFKELGGGKDVTSISMIAEEKDDEYLVSGDKRAVLGASLADAFVVLCKGSKEGWMTLVVEKGGGIEVNPAERMGLRMIPFGNLRLKEVRVPFENRMGRDGEGIIQAEYCHQVIGLKNAAQALGMAQGAFDRSIQHAKEREAFGKKLSSFQVIRHKLAEMAVGIEVARCLTYKSAAEYDQGRIDPIRSSVTRLEVGRKLGGIVYDALQIFGGIGYMAETDIEHYYRDGVVIGVDLGTEGNLKDQIAQKILGPGV